MVTLLVLSMVGLDSYMRAAVWFRLLGPGGAWVLLGRAHWGSAEELGSSSFSYGPLGAAGSNREFGRGARFSSQSECDGIRKEPGIPLSRVARTAPLLFAS